MSKDVDALVIVGHSYLIAGEAPRYNCEDVDQGLWYVRNGETAWYNGEPITEEDKKNLYASDVFLGLGGIAANRYLQQLPEWPQAPNPFREVALEVIDEISPFATGEALRSDFAIQRPNMQLTERELPKLFDAALDTDPSIADELKEKWSKAQAVHARRGKVAIMAYDASAFLERLDGLKIDEIAPDTVGFDEDLHVATESYSLGGLIDRVGAQAKLMEVPYYQTFSDTRKNGLEMLTSALEDLRLVSKSIIEL